MKTLSFQTATERYRHSIKDPNIVRDFPVDVLKAMGTDSSQLTKGPWTVTLHPYIYREFMAYCPDRKIRYGAHLGDVTRGSQVSTIRPLPASKGQRLFSRPSSIMLA